MNSTYWWTGRAPTRPARRGLVRADGRALRDDDGLHSYLGVTLFWAVYGMKFERDRILQNLDWASAVARYDAVRILAEVLDWEDRPIDPRWPDYAQQLTDTLDAISARGMRTVLTIIGGGTDDPLGVCDQVLDVVRGREHQILYIEPVNEWNRLDKVTLPELQDLVRKIRANSPNLCALSNPGSLSWEQAKTIMRQTGANLFVAHTDRNPGDRHWRQVRQSYDFIHGEPWPASDQEGPGPASSVAVLDDPRQLAIKRTLAHMAGCGLFVHHLGNGVKGVPDPARGRQANLWETPNVDAQLAALHAVEDWLPEGVQNWWVRNNGRPEHPLPLPEDDFWQGGGEVVDGAVNKNYAALGPNGQFLEVLCGVNAEQDGDYTRIGTARRRCQVNAFDPITGEIKSRTLAAGESWSLPGRVDREAGYVVRGLFV